MKKGLFHTTLFLVACNMLLQQSSVFAGDKDKTVMTDQFRKDTARIRFLNATAYQYYLDYQYDSCYKYGLQALQLSNSLYRTVWPSNETDDRRICTELKAISLANLARGLKKQNTLNALDTLDKALGLIKQTGNDLAEGRIYESIGSIYEFSSKEQEALQYHLLALESYKRAYATEKVRLQLINVAIAYRSLGNYGDALEYLIESLDLSKQNSDTAGIIESLLAMGFTYMYVEKYEEALAAQQEALGLYTLLGDSLGMARIYNDIGVVEMQAGNYEAALVQHQKALALRMHSMDYYYTYASYSYIGQMLVELGKYSEAIDSYRSGMEYAKLAGEKIAEINSHLYLGSAYMNLGDTDQAILEYQQAIELCHSVEDRTSEALASMKIAGIYLERNQPAIALTWLQKAEKVVPRATMANLTNIYQNIAESYYKLGDYKKAYLNAMLYVQAKDSLVKAENLEKLTSLTNRLEFENKKKLQDETHRKMMQVKQAEIEKQKVVKNFTIFGASVIFVLAIIFFIRFVEKNRLNSQLKVTLKNLKAAQSQLVHAEKMASLGELTAGIAHEIQNPLNFVNNFSEVNLELLQELKEELKKGDLGEIDAIAEDLIQNEEKINSHGKRADSIVKGMLQHSRRSNGQKAPTDINALAGEYLRLAYHGLRAKDKTFNADYRLEADENLPPANVVPQDIGRVLLNLINNAFYAVSNKAKLNIDGYIPEVVVRTKKSGNKTEIRIVDNGEGIPDDIKDKIFQPFFTTKPTGEGTGLGLSIAYEIITKGHGGELLVESLEGEGTTFTLLIAT